MYLEILEILHIAMLGKALGHAADKRCFVFSTLTLGMVLKLVLVWQLKRHGFTVVIELNLSLLSHQN